MWNHVYDLLLEMELQAGQRASTKLGTSAWALRARAAARAGQRAKVSGKCIDDPKKLTVILPTVQAEI